MLEVVLLVNLKTQTAGVIPKGTKFRGNLDEFPAFVVRLVKDNRSSVCRVTEIEVEPEPELIPQYKAANKKKRSNNK